MARAVGVDIGERYLKVVELTGSGRSFRIQRVAIRQIPGEGENGAHGPDLSEDLVIEESGELHREPEDEAPEPSRDEKISELIGEVFSSLKLAREDVCATFPAHASINREILVPFFDEDQIRKVVRFEAENHLHSQAIDDVIVNWIKTGETKDGSRLSIFASPKTALIDHLARLRRARVDPASVDLDATALYTALDAAGVFDAHPNVIVVDIGASASTLMLTVDGRPRVLRSFRLGAGNLESGLGEELGVEPAQTRQVGAQDDLLVPASDLPSAEAPHSESERSLAQLQTEVAVDHRGRFVQKLHREAVRSLASVSTVSPPDRLLLLGGGSLVPGLPEALGERFGLPVERLDLLEHVDCRDAGTDREYAGAALGPAIGCALRMLGRNPFGIELLQEEFAPRNVFEVIRTTLATGISLLFLALLVYTFGVKTETRAERIKYTEMWQVVSHMTMMAETAYQKEIEHKTPDQAKSAALSLVGRPTDEKRIAYLRSLLIRRHRFLQSELGLRTDIPRLPSAVKCMYEFYKALSSVPREKLGTFFQIHDMDIRERHATVKIIVDTPSVLDTVRRLLLESPYFKQRAKEPVNFVEVGAQTPIEGGLRKQSFTITFREE